MKLFAAFVAGLSMACIIAVDSHAAPQNQCAKPGASYLATCAETSGNCGAMVPLTFGASDTRTLVAPIVIVCQSRSSDGCHEVDTGCSWTLNGQDYLTDFETTFNLDGSGGTAHLPTAMIDSLGNSCTGVYDCTITKM